AASRARTIALESASFVELGEGRLSRALTSGGRGDVHQAEIPWHRAWLSHPGGPQGARADDVRDRDHQVGDRVNLLDQVSMLLDLAGHLEDFVLDRVTEAERVQE